MDSTPLFQLLFTSVDNLPPGNDSPSSWFRRFSTITKTLFVSSYEDRRTFSVLLFTKLTMYLRQRFI